MSAVAPSKLPTWDLSAAFPSLDSQELNQAMEEVRRGIADFDVVLSNAEKSGSPLDDRAVLAFEQVVGAYNELGRKVHGVSAYIHGTVAVDSRNDLALAKQSELDVALIPFSKAGTRFAAWLGTLPLEELLGRSQVAKDHEFALKNAQIQAKHLMSPAEEALAADLEPTSRGAWGKLHGNVSSQIDVEVELKGELQRMPMSMVRNLAYDPDREVRRVAYEAELRTWKHHEVPLAAALNGVKGTINTLSKKRGWESPLDAALFGANIDRQTLDAMLSAAREAFPDFRRYLKAKAKLLRVPKLAFYDIFAPVGGAEKTWEYEEAESFVARQFHSYSDKLGGYAERSFRDRWIDAEPKPGKRDGAFCMWLLDDQSRILMNYKTSFGSVKTLAHELGHGYHNLCLANRTVMQRSTPMTLAETASIFCETIVQNAALKDADADEQLLILEGSLQGACQVTVDITSRFLFEQRVFEGREKRELSATEFCDAMLWAQKETYGDGLDETQLHPYMWAAKPHYYSRSYYNFPYMYGLLFALGLYSQYLKDPESFKSRYDDLLSSTGLADAATLGARFGFDVRTVEFWRSSLDVIRKQIEQFESVVG